MSELLDDPTWPMQTHASAEVETRRDARPATASRPRIVVDVSTTMAWQRPPVGIVRTEQKFVSFLLAQRDVDVAFCQFDRGAGMHVMVTREEVRARLAPTEVRPAPSERADDSVTRARARVPVRNRMRASLASLTRRSIDRLPAAMRPEAMLFAESSDRFVRGLYWLGRNCMSRVTGRASRPSADPARAERTPASPAPLTPADVYVSLGLDWEYNDLVALGRLKRAVGFRTLLQCYDLIPVRFPHFTTFDAREYYSRYFTRLAAVADHVVAISQATLDDYRRFLDAASVAAPAMSVLHLGTDLDADGGPARGTPPRPDLAERPFVLCVGTIEARKNHELLYQVWDRLAAAHGDRTPLLVLVGMCGWGVDDLLSRIRVNRRIADRIVILDRVADDALVWLYEHCLFTVFPSFCEGLGLPVVESLAFGKPCIVSDAPAVVEVSRGLVPALDPLDLPAWHRAIERWAFDPDALAAAALPLRTYRAPSWHDYGTGMLALIRDLAARSATDGLRRAAR